MIGVNKKDVLSLIGNTPLITAKLFDDFDVTFHIKLEMFNPTGSIKDRTAYYMIKDAEEKYNLKEYLLIEASSGNTAISLAMICALKGYKLKIFLPKSTSKEKISLLESFGPEIVKVNGTVLDAYKQAIDYSKKDKKSIFLNQYSNPSNFKAHYFGTGREIIKDLGKEIKNVDYFVAGVGTGGTITGIGMALKEANPEIKVIGVIPEKPESIEGLKDISSWKGPLVLKKCIVDKIIRVSGENLKEYMFLCAKKTGVLPGLSSAACIKGIKDMLEEGKIEENTKIITIFPDSGIRYLSKI